VSTTPAVDAIGKIHLEGNIVPASWYQHISTKDGKPDFVAITILSDIVYWYRPTEIRDEQTGLVVGYKKKFAADKLQRSYDQLATQFSVSKEQARDACHRLRDAGLIAIEIRHGVRYGQGMIANNVVYMEPIAAAILEISYRVTQVGGAKQPTLPPNVDTNTVTSTEISSSLSKGGEPKAKEPEAKTPKQEALESLEKVFFQYGGTLSPPLIERFYAVVDGNPDHPTERFAHAKKKLEETRSFFKAIDAYREWTLPKPQSTYQRPKPGIGRASPPRAEAGPITPDEKEAKLREWVAARTKAGMDVPEKLRYLQGAA
jgi:hypothetical protein